MTRVAAGAAVQTSAAARVKTKLKRRFRTTTTLESLRAGVLVVIKARVKAEAGVKRGEWRRRSPGAGAGAKRRAGVRRKASAGAGAREAAGAAAGVVAKARTRGRGGREAGRRAAVGAAAAAAVRAREAENAAASETASQAAARRRRGKTLSTPGPDLGPARLQRSGNVPSLSPARGKAEGRAKMLAPIRRPGPGQGPIPNQNQTFRQNHAPGQSLLQKPDLGPSLDPGLHPDHLPGLDLDPTQDPNWLRPQLELPEKFCTCLVAVAQVIEVEHMSLLYIFNSPNGVSTIVKSKCFLSVKPPGARPSCSTENNLLFENPFPHGPQ